MSLAGPLIAVNKAIMKWAAASPASSLSAFFFPLFLFVEDEEDFFPSGKNYL